MLHYATSQSRFRLVWDPDYVFACNGRIVGAIGLKIFCRVDARQIDEVFSDNVFRMQDLTAGAALGLAYHAGTLAVQ